MVEAAGGSARGLSEDRAGAIGGACCAILSAAIAYPGLGALEASNLSVGRGTEKPFLLYGAPWIDAAALCRELESRKLPGVRWKPAMFCPAIAEKI